MGTWGIGVFDNDVAAEWADDFDGASPDERSAVVRTALTNVFETDDDTAECVALAAATTVASSLPGGPLLAPSYGPKSLDEQTFEVADDLPDLAVLAMNRVMSPRSEWSARWSHFGSLDDAVAVVEAVIDELELRVEHDTSRTALAS